MTRTTRNPLQLAEDRLALSLLWNAVQGFANFALLLALYLEVFK